MKLSNIRERKREKEKNFNINYILNQIDLNRLKLEPSNIHQNKSLIIIMSMYIL